MFTSADPEKGKHRGVIYTIAPSYKDGNVIWVGTDDGLIQITRDGGKTWTNVTPPGAHSLEQSVGDGCLAFRYGVGLRRHQPLPAGRSASAHLAYA